MALTIDPERATRTPAAQVLSAAGAVRRGGGRRAAAPLDLESGAAQTHYALGTALMRLGRADEGEKELKEFERLQQEAAAAHARDLELGGLRREASVSSAQRRPREGRRAPAPGARTRPDDPVVAPQPRHGLALAGQAGRGHRAIQRRGRAERPADVHQHLAEAYAALGRADDSRRELDVYEQLKRTACGGRRRRRR